MANIYSGNNTGKALPVFTGRFETTVAAGSPLTSIVVANSAVLADNTIIFSMESDSTNYNINQSPYISARTIGTNFTITLDSINGGGTPISVFVDYAIF